MWRHAQEMGLKPAYEQRGSIHGYIRQLLALPFLPVHHIPEAFHRLEARANSDGLQALVGYIRRQWIDSTLFPVEDWSIFGHTVRTNNDTEGKHKDSSTS